MRQVTGNLKACSYCNAIKLSLQISSQETPNVPQQTLQNLQYLQTNQMASDSDSTVIVVVFVSLGGFCFLAFVVFALCCFIKYRKKASQEADNVRVDEHMKIKEDVVEGPHGTKAVVLTIEDDVHIEEDIRKNDKFGEGMHAKSALGIDVAESSSGPGHQQLEQKPQVQRSN